MRRWARLITPCSITPCSITPCSITPCSITPCPGWREAMARRGLDNLDLVRPCPLSTGDFGIQGEQGKRLLRVLSFVQHRPEDHAWAHPIDGVVAFVDVIERRVVELIDHEVMPVPREEGNFDDPS